MVGRRGGKSHSMATVATYIAGLCDHSDAFVPGERGVLLCIALDQRVAKIVLDYGEAYLRTQSNPEAAHCGPNADALELTNGISLEVRPASFRKLRGPTYVAVIADEFAFWYVDASLRQPGHRNSERSRAWPRDDRRSADPGFVSHMRGAAFCGIYSNAIMARMAIR